MSGGKYRIKSSTIALFVENGSRIARTIPAGAIVEIENSSSLLDGLVEVIWEERKAMMFAQDVRSRGERIEQ